MKAAEAEQKLLRDRQELYEFQKKVDDARDAAGKQGISAKELDAGLKRDIPEAVRLTLSDNARAELPAAQIVSAPREIARPGNATTVFTP